jgi:non-ribosomal peptide synthetase component F
MVSPFNESEISVFNPEQPFRSEESLTDTERHKLLVEWNNTTREYLQDKCIHQLFEEQVERTPDAVALVFEGKQLTYRELNARANQLAHYLQGLGVGPEVLVGICVERSIEMIVGLLSVLKAGGAYIPLDPAYPLERLGFMLEDSSVPVLLTQSKLIEKLPPHSARVVYLDKDWEEIVQPSKENPSSSVTSYNLAYVIYTSGSTGKPKGVLVAHKGLCNLATSTIQLFDVQPKNRILQFASFSFDASVWEVVMALVSGATLVMAKREIFKAGVCFAGRLRDEAITMVILPPSILAVLPAEEFPALQTIIVGGEACSTDLVARWHQASVLQTLTGQQKSQSAPPSPFALMGVKNRRSDERSPTPQSIFSTLRTNPYDRRSGEIPYRRCWLARGYLNRPDLTEQKFILIH